MLVRPARHVPPHLAGRYVTPGAFFESARAAGLSEADIAAGDQRRILQARGPALLLPEQPSPGTALSADCAPANVRLLSEAMQARALPAALQTRTRSCAPPPAAGAVVPVPARGRHGPRAGQEPHRAGGEQHCVCARRPAAAPPQVWAAGEVGRRGGQCKGRDAAAGSQMQGRAPGRVCVRPPARTCHACPSRPLSPVLRLSLPLPPPASASMMRWRPG